MRGVDGFHGVHDTADSHRAVTRAPRRGAAFDGEPGMIAEARRFARDFLTQLQGEFGVPVSTRLLGDTQLVVSELVTNARKYAPGPCLLDLQLLPDAVEITVWDSESALPIARAAEPGRIGQHGIEIVLALCEGFDVRREPVGKRIKVRLALADGPH
ncbi:ATP-binding protein [Streptomyces sp. NPDC006638]|uniref:ATP-binding protein n=2 Tax=unclassified Streptomyces TaxID=2593676 RepID=UPI0033B3BB52